MQKVGQKDRGTEFGPGPPVGGLRKESLLWAGGAFGVAIITFERRGCICAYYSSV